MVEDESLAFSTGKNLVHKSATDSSAGLGQSSVSSSINGGISSKPGSSIGPKCDLRDLRVKRNVSSEMTVAPTATDPSSRRRVNQRWYYESRTPRLRAKQPFQFFQNGVLSLLNVSQHLVSG